MAKRRFIGTSLASFPIQFSIYSQLAMLHRRKWKRKEERMKAGFFLDGQLLPWSTTVIHSYFLNANTKGILNANQKFVFHFSLTFPFSFYFFFTCLVKKGNMSQVLAFFECKVKQFSIICHCFKERCMYSSQLLSPGENRDWWPLNVGMAKMDQRLRRPEPWAQNWAKCTVGCSDP